MRDRCIEEVSSQGNVVKRLFDLVRKYRHALALPFRMGVFRHLILVAVAAALSMHLPATHAQSAEMAPRIDTPVTAENSVRVNLGGGVLRVPRFLVYNKVNLVNPAEPINLEAMGFTFWYPDMTITPLLGGADRRDTSVDSGSKLKVYVSWMTYSSDDRAARSPRPSDIVARETDESRKYAPPEITDTLYPNVRRLSFEKATLKEFPNYKLPPKVARTYLYIQGEKSPYELYMVCGSSCSATMYSRVHHFHLDVWIYGSTEQVLPHADEIFTAMNGIVVSWLPK